jgi:DNA-binding NtrC family response regulator
LSSDPEDEFEPETRSPGFRRRLDDLSVVVMTDRGMASFRLPPKGEFTIGRAERCDLRIDDDDVSRRHARITVGVALLLEDLGSRNGTRVGTRLLRAGQRMVIECGEVIEIGGAILMVRGALVTPRPESAGKSWRERLLPLLERVANATINVLILGETGVGKEVTAENLHRLSPRVDRPLLRLNCAALPEALLESELFGHERGAFTGAVQAKPGLITNADGGTVFLDEVGELPLSMQAKLLRVIDAREVLPLGALKPRPIDVRILAATNRNLEAEVEAGRFRRDLYFRLNGISIEVPPLRARKDEIEPLARLFLERAAGGASVKLHPDAVEALRNHSFPGNIRELRNLIERAFILSGGRIITREHLPGALEPAPFDGGETAPRAARPVDEEHARLLEALERANGNQTRAAKLLGVSRRTLVTRLDKYNVPRPRRH